MLVQNFDVSVFETRPEILVIDIQLRLLVCDVSLHNRDGVGSTLNRVKHGRNAE